MRFAIAAAMPVLAAAQYWGAGVSAESSAFEVLGNFVDRFLGLFTAVQHRPHWLLTAALCPGAAGVAELLHAPPFEEWSLAHKALAAITGYLVLPPLLGALHGINPRISGGAIYWWPWISALVVGLIWPMPGPILAAFAIGWSARGVTTSLCFSKPTGGRCEVVVLGFWTLLAAAAVWEFRAGRAVFMPPGLQLAADTKPLRTLHELVVLHPDENPVFVLGRLSLLLGDWATSALRSRPDYAVLTLVAPPLALLASLQSGFAYSRLPNSSYFFVRDVAQNETLLLLGYSVFSIAALALLVSRFRAEQRTRGVVGALLHVASWWLIVAGAGGFLVYGASLPTAYVFLVAASWIGSLADAIRPAVGNAGKQKRA